MANQNNTGLKALGAVLTILAVITGIAAIVRPMQQRNDNLEKQIDSLKNDLRDHAKLNNHPWGVVAEIAEMREKFTEVETQFKGSRERDELLTIRHEDRLTKLEQWQDWWYKEIAIKENAKGSE